MQGQYIRKIAAGLNVFPLAMALGRQPELWNRHKIRAEHAESPHREVDDILVRYRAWRDYTGDVSVFNQPHDSVWYDEFYALPQVRQLVFKVMNMIDGERLGGVLITKIPAGKTCYPHVDSGWHAAYYDKYAVQIASAPGQAFCFEGESLDAQPGDVYWFRNDVPHWVLNPTDFDRITLIISIRSDNLLRGAPMPHSPQRKE